MCSTFMSSFCLVKVFRSFPIGSIDSSSLSRRSIQFFTACKLTRHAASSPAFFCSSSQIWFFNLWKRIRKLQSRLDILLKNKDNQRKSLGGEQLPSQEKWKSLHSPICIPHKECYCLSRHLLTAHDVATCGIIICMVRAVDNSGLINVRLTLTAEQSFF